MTDHGRASRRRRRQRLHRRTASVHALGAVLLAAGALLSACGGDSPAGDGESGELLVFAAASLTEAFTQVGAAFEGRHGGVTVTFNFGPSDGLATQIGVGAQADVFASASPRWMDEVEQNGPGVSDRANFVRNRLVVIVPADNPAGIEAIEDLANPGVKLVLAGPDVPIGGYAREALANAGIADDAEANVVSNEEDVKAVVQKVVLGEADAGIVYVTDVTPDVASNVSAIEIPEEVNVLATYPIAVVTGAPNPGLAAQFVQYVLGDGQASLHEHDFLPPS